MHILYRFPSMVLDGLKSSCNYRLQARTQINVDLTTSPFWLLLLRYPGRKGCESNSIRPVCGKAMRSSVEQNGRHMTAKV